MWCLVSIFNIGINSESFPWPVHSGHETPQIFCDVRRGLPTSLHFCQYPTLRNRTENTALLLVRSEYATSVCLVFININVQ